MIQTVSTTRKVERMVSKIAASTQTGSKGQRAAKPAASFLDDLPDAALLGRDVWMSALSCSGETVRRRIKDGVIPQPCVWLTRCTPRWRAGVVRATLARLVAGKEAA